VHTVRTWADSALSPLRGRREISATWTALRAQCARAKPSCPEIRQCLNAWNRQPRDFVCPHVLAQILLHTPLLRLEPPRRGCRKNTNTQHENRVKSTKPPHRENTTAHAVESTTALSPAPAARVAYASRASPYSVAPVQPAALTHNHSQRHVLSATPEHEIDV